MLSAVTVRTVKLAIGAMFVMIMVVMIHRLPLPGVTEHLLTRRKTPFKLSTVEGSTAQNLKQQRKHSNGTNEHTTQTRLCTPRVPSR